MARPSRTSKKREHLHLVLLAGGRGTRFWPLSRCARPKQMLDITGEGPMLVRTLERVEMLAPRERVLAVTSEDLAASVREALDLPARNVLAEPAGRNTAAAIALAALVASTRDPDAVLLVLPSDHHVARPAKLRALLAAGALAAGSTRRPVLLGVSPAGPLPHYGYIVPGREATGANGMRAVARFQEKPAPAAARKLIARGALWNAGIFCLHAAATLELVAEHLPELASALRRLVRHVDTKTWQAALRREWADVPSASFDRAVIEKSSCVVLPADVGWSDVGSWETLAALLPRDAAGNAWRGPAYFDGCEGSLAISAWGEGRTLVLFGVNDLLVVDAGDVVLACPRSESSRLGELLARLERERPELT